MRARTHAWKWRGEKMFIFKALKRGFFFPTIATNWQEEMHRANGGKTWLICRQCAARTVLRMNKQRWQHTAEASGQKTLSFKNRLRNHVMDNNAFSIKKMYISSGQKEKKHCLRRLNVFLTNLNTPQHTHNRRLVAGLDLIQSSTSLPVQTNNKNNNNKHKQERMMANAPSDSWC